jgi:hypothetical protein
MTLLLSFSSSAAATVASSSARNIIASLFMVPPVGNPDDSYVGIVRGQFDAHRLDHGRLCMVVVFPLWSAGVPARSARASGPGTLYR